MIRYIIAAILVVFSTTTYCYSQCKDSRAEKVGQHWIEYVVKECTSTPNLLKTRVTKCEYSRKLKDNTPGWRIWVTAEWQGRYTTMKYNLSLYIEELHPPNSESGTTTIYYTGYSNTLTFRCVDLSATKPLTLEDGSVHHTPFREFSYLAVKK